MRELWQTITATWWGITLFCVACAAVWLLLSTLLYRQFFKRFYDILLSFLAIAVLSPILLILMLVGALAMKGNPFFTQQRPGRINKRTGEEKIFKLIKFRTMTCEKDENGRLLPDDKRLTGYGKFLRSSSLDELPELFNIFVGQMSIIGPRPLLIKDKLFMSDEVRRRHSVRPGLSGLAQVNGRNSIDWDDKFKFDLQYISKITLWRDFAIVVKTVFKVFKRSDINREGTESDIDYGDWLVAQGKITQEQFDEVIASYEERKNEYKKWHSYNHGIIPSCAPSDNLVPFDTDELFKKLGGILIRYTTDFDCGEETGWWYVIKDTPFDIASLKAKRRYEITKGTRNFTVRTIEADKYKDALFNVQVEAFKAYPEKYRPTVERNTFEQYIEQELCSENAVVYGAFAAETDELCGYAYVRKDKKYWNFSVLKTVPRCERDGVNAALIYQMLLDFNKEKEAGSDIYINDGERSVIHETAFPDYLEKYFGFRKAYCKLHIVYNRKYKALVKIAYSMRKILAKMDNIGLIHKVNGILKMEEIIRTQSKPE